MKKYFDHVRTAEELKKAYRAAAMKLHPDNGGDAEQFKIMQQEYEKVFERVKNIHTTAEGETYEKETDETPEAFMDIINKVIFMDGITIEIIGSWIWLTGNTMAYKDEIKAAGFWWSKSKKAWYWNGSTTKTRRRGRYSMNKLREVWNTQEVKTKEQKKLTA